MLMTLLAITDGLTATAPEYDIVIRKGRVADGTGNPAFFADVAVRDSKVAAIGHIAGKGRQEIDASGLIVAPGFIDVHTHADEIAEMPLAENFVRMGVTTVVAGNCGASALDIAGFYRGVESTNVAVNVTTLVGHNDVREAGMGGGFDRPPTPAEMEKMKGLVDRAMKDGAAGLSTGLIYQPGTFARTDEIVELAKVASQHGGIYTSHMRYEDHDIFKALEEVFRIAREAGIRAEVSHLKLAGPTAWGKANQVLELIEHARAEGLDITQDQYAYTASSTGISQLIPDSAFDGGRDRFLERLRDPAEKARIKQAMVKRLRQKGREDYEYSVIASYRKDSSLNGLSIVEAAKRVRGNDSLDDQVELILEIQMNGGATGVFHGMNEEDLQLFMRHPNTMIACDSGLRKFGSGVPHPRGYGNNARVLARYVRELKILRLEDAIRKMTSLPAATFQFENRGLLKPGFWADIVVFDPETVQDRATYKDPHNYPAGIPWVMVNGTLVLNNGVLTQAKAGMALRHRDR
jgi:N-acyl-D-amino-acid deacylase